MASSSTYAFFHCHYAFQKFSFFCVTLCLLHALQNARVAFCSHFFVSSVVTLMLSKVNSAPFPHMLCPPKQITPAHNANACSFFFCVSSVVTLMLSKVNSAPFTHRLCPPKQITRAHNANAF